MTRFTRSTPRLIAWILTAATLLPAVTSFAAHSPRNYLTVQGKVVDPRGRPLPGAWVYCTGSRRSGATADSAGAYTLEIPGATLQELETAPLRIRIQARLKGWRFATESGSPELGIEMKLTKLESGLARLRIRSNDPDAVQAVAGSVVLDANPRALLERTFIGSQGAQYETPPVPLTSGDEVTVAGDSPSIPEIGDVSDGPLRESPAAPAAPDASGGAATTEPPAREQEAPAEKPAIALETTPAPASPSPAPAPVKPRKKDKKKEPESTPSVTTAKAPEVAASTPTVPKTPEVLASTTGPASPPVVVERPLVMRVPPRHDSLVAQTRRDERGKVTVFRPGQGPGDSRRVRERDRKPPVIRPAEPLSPEPPAEKRSDQPVSEPAESAPRPAATVDRTPDPRMAPPVVASDPGLKPVLIRGPSAAAVDPRPPIEARPVTPAPQDARSTERVATPRPLPRTPGAPATPLPMCDCTIRGTVEIQSDRPLQSRTEVVISIEGTDVTTNVELFMGSPRAFEIHPAPCGVHRFVLHTRSKQRFVLVSAEPRLVCTEGGRQQVRLVLEPVARWGASR